MGYRCVSMWFAASVASVLICGCPDNGDSEADGGTTSETGDSMTAPETSETMPSTTSSNCVLGQLGCECLNGACAGSFFCVENMCVEGPQFEPQQDDIVVLAGLRVPFDVDLMADEFSWEQVDGPEVTLSATDLLNFQVDIPPGANDGAEITLRLSASRNGVEGSEDYTIQVLGASFVDLYDGAEEGVALPAEVGTSVALQWGQGSLWVVSSEGNITRINADDLGLQENIDVGGTPAGIALGQIGNGDDSVDVAFIANPGLMAVQSLTVFGANLNVFTDTISGGGGPVGEVGHLLFDGNNNDLYFTNGLGGQFMMYDDNDDSTYMLGDALGTEPSAMAIGPDANTVFVATLGEVWRVPILLTDEDPQTPFAGEAELYVDLGGDGDPLNAISALRFDDGANLWIAMPGINTLHVARYSGGGSTDPIRTFDSVPAGLNTFNGLAFNGDWIWWANGAASTIGGLRVGLGGF